MGRTMDANQFYNSLTAEHEPKEVKKRFIEYLAASNQVGLVLSGIDLSNSDLSGISLFKAQIKACNFSNCTFKNSELTGAIIVESNFSNSHMQHAGFGSATIKSSIFFDAHLEHTTFTSSCIESSDFRCADFTDARIREAQLLQCDFTHAKMLNCNVSLSNVDGSNFNEVLLGGSRVRAISGFESAQWIGTDIRDINFAGAYQLRRYIQDENYIFEFKNRSKSHFFYYLIWKATSDCGRSLSRWIVLILLQIALFTFIYTMVKIDYGLYETPISPFYFSISTMTTLGYGDAIPVSWIAQMCTSTQVVLGYVMLGGLLSILTNKLARRAD